MAYSFRKFLKDLVRGAHRRELEVMRKKDIIVPSVPHFLRRRGRKGRITFHTI